MSRGHDLAAAAGALIGVPFRLHGRDPQTGLDCVGLCLSSLNAIGHAAAMPACYGFRNSSLDRPLALAESLGLVPARGAVEPGDILLLRLSAVQAHLVIADNRDFIHAHAGLRRVVRSPGPVSHPVIRHWRLDIPS